MRGGGDDGADENHGGCCHIISNCQWRVAAFTLTEPIREPDAAVIQAI